MELPIYFEVPAILKWSYLYTCYTTKKLPIYLLYYGGVTYIPAILQ